MFKNLNFELNKNNCNTIQKFEFQGYLVGVKQRRVNPMNSFEVTNNIVDKKYSEN